ncbi:TraA family conjugative transfer protein [Sutterella sp.]|uniref:TraA family conjugative transfer protein n=1 Tax=Sutterella sp. TaxID=1981025 RepID=UPI003FD8B97F
MNFKNLSKIALGVALIGGAAAVYAGVGGNTPGGDEFTDIWNLIQGWSQGVLGRIIALGALIVGIAFGLVRQSVVAAVIGISMAIVLQYGPDVIEGIVTASAADAQPAQVVTLDNGMAQQNLDVIVK